MAFAENWRFCMEFSGVAFLVETTGIRQLQNSI
jgi:hypothetical protein